MRDRTNRAQNYTERERTTELVSDAEAASVIAVIGRLAIFTGSGVPRGEVAGVNQFDA